MKLETIMPLHKFYIPSLKKPWARAMGERGGLYSRRFFLRIATGKVVAMRAKRLVGIRGV